MRITYGSMAVLGLLVAGAAARADIIEVTGLRAASTEGLGAFSASIEYNYLSGDQGQLLLDLTNTSDPANGGYITAFVFNIDASGPRSAALVESSRPAMVDLSSDGRDASPFGWFDAGAGIGGQFLGGGNPSGGVAVGHTGFFEFLVTSEAAHALTASSFVSGPNEYDFVVRFRGFADGGSDKVPVPAPGSMALLGLGALSISCRRRRSA